MVVCYGGIVSSQPSVTRAVLAAVVYLAVGAMGLAAGALHVLALVALIAALADPLAVIDVGAWLSFGATLGIIAAAPRVATAMATRLGAAVGWRRFARAAVGLLAATAAAEAMATMAMKTRAGLCKAACCTKGGILAVQAVGGLETRPLPAFWPHPIV